MATGIGGGLTPCGFGCHGRVAGLGPHRPMGQRRPPRYLPPSELRLPLAPASPLLPCHGGFRLAAAASHSEAAAASAAGGGQGRRRAEIGLDRELLDGGAADKRRRRSISRPGPQPASRSAAVAAAAAAAAEVSAEAVAAAGRARSAKVKRGVRRS